MKNLYTFTVRAHGDTRQLRAVLDETEMRTVTTLLERQEGVTSFHRSEPVMALSFHESLDWIKRALTH